MSDDNTIPYLWRSNERYWRYKSDLDMTDPNNARNFVRVTFKTNLTDKATDLTTEFKPFAPPPSDNGNSEQGRQQMQTDSLGLQFMLQMPFLGVEPWQGESAEPGDALRDLNLAKVKHDVMVTATAEKFTSDHQWYIHVVMR
eukprot:6193911-Pleurochrysis_carterae.AAC.4